MVNEGRQLWTKGCTMPDHFAPRLESADASRVMSRSTIPGSSSSDQLAEGAGPSSCSSQYRLKRKRPSSQHLR